MRLHVAGSVTRTPISGELDGAVAGSNKFNCTPPSWGDILVTDIMH